MDLVSALPKSVWGHECILVMFQLPYVLPQDSPSLEGHIEELHSGTGSAVVLCWPTQGFADSQKYAFYVKINDKCLSAVADEAGACQYTTPKQMGLWNASIKL